MNSRSILLLGFLSISLFATAQRKVLIMGIDGCRGDAIVAANAPRLDSLRNSGYQTLEGNTHAPTWSGTGWSSMLTGVWETKHGVTNNSFSGSQFGMWPHFFAHLRSARPELDLRSYAHWSPVNTQITTAADEELNFGTDQAVADAAVNILRNGDPDVLFLHFDDVDHAGHAYGFQTNIPNYLAAIEDVDEQLGPIMAALADRPASEEWLVYVTTDHGGTPAGHGGNALDQQRIFAFASAPDIEPSIGLAQKDTLFMPASVLFSSVGHAEVSDPVPYRFGATGDFTIECRVRMPLSWSGDPVFVGDKNWNSGNNVGYVLSTTGGGYNWKFNIGDGTDRVDLTGFPINDGQWHHLAVSCDRDGSVFIMQDGMHLGAASMNAIGNINSGLGLCFGQDGTSTYGVGLTGEVADVRIWDAALPFTVLSDWSGKALTSAHPYSATLSGHWPMNEGSGGDFANAVAGSPDATHYAAGTPTSATWVNDNAQLVTTDLTRSPAQVDMVPSILAHLCIANEPAWQLDGHSLVPVCAPLVVKARTFLEGPFDAVSGMMHDSLRTQGLVPMSEPYTGLAFDRAGSGGETLSPSILNVSGPDAIVDWVLLEVRDPIDPSRLMDTKACLVQRDGDIVDTDGTSLPKWNLLVGDYHIALRHRNHLGVMSGSPIQFSFPDTVTFFADETSTGVHGTGALHVLGSTALQWAGNALADSVVAYTGAGNDRDKVLVAIGGQVATNTVTGYRSEDVNLDGTVKYTGQGNDRDAILRTIGGVVATNTRPEQLP